MCARSSSPHCHFRSIPLQLVMVLLFVVQALIIVGLINNLSDTDWESWIYGLVLMLSIGFGLSVAYGISQSYESVEIALKESQEKYKVLFQALPVGVSITDKEARILESNAISESWLGIPSPSEIECLQHREINPNVLRADGSPMPIEEYACVKAFQSNQAVYDVETGIVCTDGVLRWFNVSASPIPLEDYGVVLVHINISDRKRAELALAYNYDLREAIYNESTDAIFLVDPFSMLIFDCNRCAATGSDTGECTDLHCI